jgi:hypothetical protein
VGKLRTVLQLSVGIRDSAVQLVLTHQHRTVLGGLSAGAAKGFPAERRHPHRPREDGLVDTADTSRTNLAAALALLSRRLSKPQGEVVPPCVYSLHGASTAAPDLTRDSKPRRLWVERRAWCPAGCSPASPVTGGRPHSEPPAESTLASPPWSDKWS